VGTARSPAEETRARGALGREAQAVAWAEGHAILLEQAGGDARALLDASSGAAAVPADAAPPAAAAREAPGGLTPREREVTVLVARGNSNPQIARALTIAPRTAMRHVAHVMAKLGVHSRAAVGAWAAQQGLLGSGGA
jgi:DNA-binding NarL/FixJ family response regulator